MGERGNLVIIQITREKLNCRKKYIIDNMGVTIWEILRVDHKH